MKAVITIASLGLNALLGYQVIVHRNNSSRMDEQATRIAELNDAHAKACQKWNEEEEALKKIILDKTFEVSSLIDRINLRESLENSLKELENSPDEPSSKTVEDITADSLRNIQGILRGSR